MGHGPRGRKRRGPRYRRHPDDRLDRVRSRPCVGSTPRQDHRHVPERAPSPVARSRRTTCRAAPSCWRPGARTSVATKGASPDFEAPYECLTFEEDGEIFEIPVGHTVWYRVVGTGGTITVDTAGSDFDTVIAVYTADGAGGFDPVPGGVRRRRGDPADRADAPVRGDLGVRSPGRRTTSRSAASRNRSRTATCAWPCADHVLARSKRAVRNGRPASSCPARERRSRSGCRARCGSRSGSGATACARR